jgi:hypothetical protein
MQLKTTDTTTGFSDKDIKTMTKLSFTAPRDFHKFARLVENMAGITEILFGALIAPYGHVVQMGTFPDEGSGVDVSYPLTTRTAHGRNSRL